MLINFLNYQCRWLPQLPCDFFLCQRGLAWGSSGYSYEIRYIKRWCIWVPSVVIQIPVHLLRRGADYPKLPLLLRPHHPSVLNFWSSEDGPHSRSSPCLSHACKGMTWGIRKTFVFLIVAISSWNKIPTVAEMKFFTQGSTLLPIC